MARNVVLVTGCSGGGIGFELCLAFHAKNYKVFATARDLQKLEGLPDDVVRIKMDVTDETSIQKGVEVRLSS